MDRSNSRGGERRGGSRFRVASTWIAGLIVSHGSAVAQEADPQLVIETRAMDRDASMLAGSFVPDQVLAMFHPLVNATARQSILESVGAEYLESGEGGLFHVLQVEPGRLMEVIRELSRHPLVVFAEPNSYVSISGAPNDPLYKPFQWNLFNYGSQSGTQKSENGVRAEAAWDISKGSGTTVAVLDTGVAYEDFGRFRVAPELNGVTFVSPRNYVSNTFHANDDNGHGTHVCGTIAQRTHNALGVAGIAYQCRIMPVKVMDSTGNGTMSALANGILWAVDKGANVINMSVGSPSGSSAVEVAVYYAHAMGVVLCAAAGNSALPWVDYPARYNQCIAVGATRFDGKRAPYSCYALGLDIVAPGGDTKVDQNGDGSVDGILQQTLIDKNDPSRFGFVFLQGTSMATPHVAAIAALVKSAHPGYTNVKIREALERTTKDLGTAGWDVDFGHGLVDAYDAVRY